MQEAILESFRLSPQQRHVCALQPFTPTTPFPYRIHLLVRLEGSLDVLRLRSALHQVIERHEILRTTFPLLPGLSLPMQVIAPEAGFALSLKDLTSMAVEEWEDWLAPLLEQNASEPLPTEAIVSVTLLREQDRSHLLLLSLPAVNADIATCQLFLRELGQCYERATFEEEPLQYADLAEWQYELLTSEETTAGRGYWRTREQQAPAQVSLPFEQPSSSSALFVPAGHQLILPEVQQEALTALAQQWQVSLPALLLTCWVSVLTYLTEQPDLLVGTCFDGRRYAELAQALGPFTKYLPLSYHVTSQARPSELAQQIESLLVETQKWQEYFNWDSWQPQSQENFCSFGFEAARLPDSWQTGSLRFIPIMQQQVSDRFAVHLSCLQREQDLLVTLFYDRNRFASQDMQRLLKRWHQALEQVLSSPLRLLHDLALLTPEEEHWLNVWNSTEQDLAGSLTLLQRFEQQVARTPEDIALRFANREMSYRDLDQQANQLAHFLRHEYAVEAEMCVAICMEPSLLQIVALFGILKAGAVYLPLDPSTPFERLAFILQDAEVPLLLTQDSFREQLASLPVPSFSLEHEWERVAPFPQQAPTLVTAPDQLAYVLYTSGSSGFPKGVLVTHQGLLNYVLWAVDFYRVAQGSGTLLHSPLTFDLTITSLFPPLLAGRPVTLLPQQSGGQALNEALQTHRSLSLLKLTPTHLDLLGRSLPPENLTECSRVLIVGGEALTSTQLTLWRTYAPQTRLVNEYGPTETVVGCAIYEIPSDWNEAGAVPIGRPIANTRLYILDAWLNPVPLGMPGELYIAGMGLARGYLSRPDLTAERFVPDPFSLSPGARLYRSGDRVRLRADGQLVFLGRLDQQVKIHGYRIEPGEIEAQLLRHPQVREAVVLAWSEADEEQRLVAYLVVQEKSAELSPEQLRTFLQTRLPNYMIPSLFVILEQLPVTPHGKVDRQTLPSPQQARLQQGAPYVAPRRLEEEVLAGIWSQVLGNKRIGIDDNYFALGGDSIRSIQVITQAQERGLHLSVNLLFRFPTIRCLVDAILQQEPAEQVQKRSTAPFELLTAEDRAKLPEDVEDAYPVTMLQGGMLFHNEYSPGEGVYHDIFSYHIKLAIDLPALQEAARALVARHAVLRTAFDLTNYSEPLQLVYRQGPDLLSLEDLQHLSGEQQEKEIHAWIAAEKARGFIWSRLPLLRIHIQQRSAETAQFTLSFHHAIIDGWSDAILLTELFTHYFALLNQRDLDLSAPVAYYRDFVAMERAAVASLAHQEYWDKELYGRSFTAIPRWSQTATHQTAAGVLVVPVPLSEEISSGLKQLALSTAVPIKNVLLAAHMRVLSLLSNQDDVTTCVVSSGRPEGRDGERVLGLFINSIPFRQKLSGGTWRELVTETFAKEREALPYRRYPMAELKRRHGGLRLSETLFYFTHYHILSELQEQKNIEVLGWIPYEMSSFPLAANFFVDPFSSHVNLSLSCDGSQFSQAQAQAIAHYYTATLTALATTPQERYELAQLLSTQEYTSLLQQGTARKKNSPFVKGLYTRFEEQVERTPTAVAVVYEDKRVTYRDLNTQANQLAHHLQSLGIGPNMLVGVCIERSDTLLVALLAILKAGGAYVPLDPSYPGERLHYMLQDAQISLVLTQSHLRDLLPSSQCKVLCIDIDEDGIATHSSENLAVVLEPQHFAYVIYTSGSTGKPKGTAVYQHSFLNLLNWFISDFGICAQDRALIVTSFSFDLTQKNLFAPLLVGGTVYLPPPGYDIAFLRRFIAEAEITMLNCTPSMIYPLLSDVQGDSFDDLTSLRHVFLGGEPIALTRLQGWMQKPGFHAQIVNTYGPTECTDIVTSYRIDTADQSGEGNIPIGMPITNTETYVLDQHLNVVPIGTPGELYIGGTGVAMGYLYRPELTAEKFVPHPFSQETGARLYKTGDLVQLRPDGALEFLGRLDNQVKIRGFRIEPGEIEAALQQLPPIQQCAVITRSDRRDEKGLVAYLVLREGQEITSSQLRQLLGGSLPEYMIPATFIVLDALPLTPNGKVDRHALIGSHAQPLMSEEMYKAPRTPTEEVLQKIWIELLQRETPGIHTNFFEAGGHSLLATTLVSRVREAFQIELPLRTLFDAPTIAELAEKITIRATVAQNEDSRWEMLAEIEGLSDEEIDRLLEQEEHTPGEDDE